jgi:hypothetical protein
LAIFNSNDMKDQVIDINKKYRYKNGRAATILTTERNGVCNVVSMDDEGFIILHPSNGESYIDGRGFDLIEIKEQIKGWVNVYEDGLLGDMNESRQDADSSASKLRKRVACIYIEVNKGEGL